MKSIQDLKSTISSLYSLFPLLVRVPLRLSSSRGRTAIPYSLTSTRSLMINRLISAIPLLIATICFNNIAHAGTIRHDRADEQYTTLAELFPSVGYLDTKFSSDEHLCSATLIDPNYILTAAHCIDPNDQTLLNATFWADGVPYSVTNTTAHRGWFSSGRDFAAGYDLAVLRLETPVLHLPLAPLFTGFDESEEIGTYVGFGATGNGFTGYLPNTKGTKRAGQNIVELGSSLGLSESLLFSDFDSPFRSDPTKPDTIPLDLEYVIAPGDSGGGLFINGHIAGINSFGWGRNDGWNNSSYSDVVGSTRVSSYIDWINGAMWAMETLETNNFFPMSFSTTGNEFPENLTPNRAQQDDSFDESNGVVAIADWGFENYQDYIDRDLKETPVKKVPEPNINYGILVFGIALYVKQKSKRKN
ncbi:MAG: trypsin-like serine protease [Okeania sp. SIO3I5]|uniref:S1 family peptidase n=1 Tax=Okeania sp. SIO3I5 TaxID=2607805 RepID=UPI0013B888F5|nr:trypsin-like serine protease [Okeania sp. SIO3I5]NEQ40244.1 trypsin-like serine protease [Okeania sp. SIO3I5]